MSPACIVIQPHSSRTVVMDLYCGDYAALGLLVKSLRTLLPCDTTIQSEQSTRDASSQSEQRTLHTSSQSEQRTRDTSST